MKKILLIFVIAIACVLRFFQLGQNPVSLTWDEASWGYNAYTIGIDGKDEFGRFLPLDYLESFGDFKPPMYAYLSVLPVKLFGLNEFSTRFASAFFGVLTVLMTYFLTKRIFRENESLALFSAFFMAISPWHINLSRAAFEANVASFFIVCGVFLFLEAVQGKKYRIVFAIISFILSIYTFNSARVVSPLLVVTLALLFRKELLAKKKETAVAIIVGVLLLLPIIHFLFSPYARLRFNEVNIFTDISVIQRTNQEVTNDGDAPWSKILHNRRLAYSVEYLKHYFDHFNPSFLFIVGDGNPKFSTQDVGQMYLWELPLFIFGILSLFKKKEGYWRIVPMWLLLAIVPAATARETPHALRIEAALPTFQILTAYGVLQFINRVSTMKSQFATMQVKHILSFVVLLSLVINVIYYLYGYYRYYPIEYSGEWQYGYKQSIEYVRNMQAEYDQVWVSTALGRPYIYYLFYTQYDPQKFRANAKITRDPFGFVSVNGFDTYHFTDNFGIAEKNKKILYVGSIGQVNNDAHIFKTFNLLNGKPTLIVYTQ